MKELKYTKIYDYRNLCNIVTRYENFRNICKSNIIDCENSLLSNFTLKLKCNHVYRKKKLCRNKFHN